MSKIGDVRPGRRLDSDDQESQVFIAKQYEDGCLAVYMEPKDWPVVEQQIIPDEAAG